MPIDKSRYPPDWGKRSSRIKERDNYICQHCGAKHGESGQHDDDGFWQNIEELEKLLSRGEMEYRKHKTAIITVAHLDHDETNWEVEDDRLLSLCATCHLKYDLKDNQNRKRYGKNYRDNQMILFDRKGINDETKKHSI